MAQLRLADLLVGLSLVSDVGMGLDSGESARSCILAARLADLVAAPEPSDVYYTALLQHVGCTAYAHEAAALLGGDEIAVKRAAVRTDFSKPGEVVGSYLRALAPDAAPLARLRAAGVAVARGRQIVAGYSQANCEVAALTARRVGLGDGVATALNDVFESWDGSGAPRGLEGDAIALPARIARVASDAALFDRIGGPELALDAVRKRAGRTLDPAVCATFEASTVTLLAELAAADPLDTALAAEPAPHHVIAATELDAVARAFGDAVDLKTPLHHGHSAGVATLAGGAAERLGLDVREARLAGLLHDLGRAAVPNGIWEKEGGLTATEWERVRLHAYHGERVLARCEPLAGLAELAGSHHERLDGSGYHRGARANALSPNARVLAAADAFQAMTQRRAHREARPPDQAATELERCQGLDPEAVAAVIAAAGGNGSPRRRTWPDGLTDRQVEVLRLVAGGLSNPRIAAELVISRRTAEHHVQDVYAKIGVSSRAGAALYAMQHDLLAAQDR